MIARRWSPYVFDDRPVSQSDLRSLFEAARWAPSSYNEQPWSYIFATKEDPEPFEHFTALLRGARDLRPSASMPISRASANWAEG
ncbi:MAG: nitroreductase family protein [Methylocella sp.]